MTTTAKRYRLTIEYDESAICPCHGWDSVFELFQGNRGYGHYANAETLNALIDEGRIVAYALNVYDHSRVHYWAPALEGSGPAGPGALPQGHWRFDVAEGGAVLMVKPEFESEYAELDQDQRDANARGFLEEFNAWANGDVYAFKGTELVQCEMGEWHEVDDPDSYWIGGFYGDYAPEGIADHWALDVNGLTLNQIEFTGDAGELLGPDVWAHIEKWREGTAPEGNDDK